MANEEIEKKKKRKPSSDYKGTYAPLIAHIIKIYSLEDDDQKIGSFTGVSKDSVYSLKHSPRKTAITPLHLFLFYICAGEKYNDNLQGFLKSDPVGIDLLQSVFKDKKDSIDLSKISYDMLESERIDKFKKNLKDRIKEIGPQTDSLKDDDKQFYETAKEKFPSVCSVSLRDSVNKSNQEEIRQEYKKRNALLNLIHGISDYEYDPLDYNESPFHDKHYKALAKYAREHFDVELMNTYIQVKLDCELTISKGKATGETFFEYAVNFFETEHYSRAFKNFHIAAEDKKNVKALLVLGYWYLLGGLGVSQDVNSSIDMFEKAMEVPTNYPSSSSPCETYHFIAALFLGDIYFYGKGTNINRKKALGYYKYWLKSPKEFEKPYSCTDCRLYTLYAKCLLYGYGTNPDVDAAQLIFTNIYDDDCDCSDRHDLLEYYLCICDYKLKKNADEAFYSLKNLNSRASMNAMAKLSFEDSVNIDDDAWDNDGDCDDNDDWNIDYSEYSPNQIIAIKSWIKSAQLSLDWAYYNLFFHDIHNKDNSADYYLKAYKLNGDVASFIDEYRHTVATDILTNWNITYYENATPCNSILHDFKGNHNIWLCTKENTSSDIALYWIDSTEDANKPLPFYSRDIEQLIIVTDTDSLYDEINHKSDTAGCIVILTDLTQWTILSNTNKIITQTSHIKNGIRTLKNQYFSSQNSNQTAL